MGDNCKRATQKRAHVDETLLALEKKFHAKRAELIRFNETLASAERAGAASGEMLRKLEAASDLIHDELFDIASGCSAIPAVSEAGITAKAAVLLEYVSDDDVVGELTKSLCLDIVGLKRATSPEEAT